MAVCTCNREDRETVLRSSAELCHEKNPWSQQGNIDYILKAVTEGFYNEGRIYVLEIWLWTKQKKNI